MKRLKNLNIIVAQTKNNVIGIGNNLPWAMGTQRIDMKNFKLRTTGNIVIMGYKTWMSMGSKPLPNRMNIVLTSKNIEDQPGVFFENPSCLDTFLEDLCHVNSESQIFIIGGANLIKQVNHLVTNVYLTIIDTEVEESEENVILNTYEDLGLIESKEVHTSEYPSDEHNHFKSTFHTFTF
ncbi:gp158 [Sphingomonas phage PAU]|uniref:gp158 n=1 Tax=Sphingomonas phage PAU TaxID=1150991 RepID=UPI00025732EA|nr:gp158 [Sphingomonas phage PAU]AFF28156.1 gp158 [Sphingomonas phage PAU]